MILLDTNVISEVMAPHGRVDVVEWLDRQAPLSVFLSALTLAELRAGIERLPEGRRRADLDRAFMALRDGFFRERIVAFDSRAALEYGRIHALRMAAGRPISVFDGLIAAMARANAMMLATRNVRDFEGLDLPLVNPFDD